MAIQYEAVMLLNTVRVKGGVSFSAFRSAVNEVFKTVDEYYNGYIGVQVFEFSGLLGEVKGDANHCAFLTYWIVGYERPDIDKLFGDIVEFVSEPVEIGYTFFQK